VNIVIAHGGGLYRNFLHVLKRAFPDPAERRLIMGGNLTRILDLQVPSPLLQPFNAVKL
jgi:hypothetical protein